MQGLQSGVHAARWPPCRRAALSPAADRPAPPRASASRPPAGQGYLWLAHRDPSSPAWQLAMGSKAMWPQLLAPVVPELTAEAVEWQVGVEILNLQSQLSVHNRGSLLLLSAVPRSCVWMAAVHGPCSPCACLTEWAPYPDCLQSIGSVLIATDAEETEALHRRAALLQRAGLDARCLPAADVPQLEPALALGADGSALLVPSDAQVNGRAAAAALLRACQAHGARFCALFQEDAAALDQGPSGRVTAVRSEARRWGTPVGVPGVAWCGRAQRALVQECWRCGRVPHCACPGCLHFRQTPLTCLLRVSCIVVFLHAGLRQHGVWWWRWVHGRAASWRRSSLNPRHIGRAPSARGGACCWRCRGRRTCRRWNMASWRWDIARCGSGGCLGLNGLGGDLLLLHDILDAKGCIRSCTGCSFAPHVKCKRVMPAAR